MSGLQVLRPVPLKMYGSPLEMRGLHVKRDSMIRTDWTLEAETYALVFVRRELAAQLLSYVVLTGYRPLANLDQCA